MRSALVLLLVLSAGLCAQTLYLDDLGTLFTVDASTGAATMVGSTGPIAALCGLSHDGTTLFALDKFSGGGSTGGLWIINPVTGAPALAAATGLTGWTDLCWDPTNLVFYASSSDDTLRTIDLFGTVTLVGSTPGPMTIAGLAFDAAGTLWGINASGSGELGVIDPSNGSFLTVSTTQPGFQAIDFHPVTGVLYATNALSDALYTIDPNTGSTTLVGSHGIPGGGFARALRFDPSSVPSVLASLTLVGTGCAGSNGVPVLSSVGLQLPVIGNSNFGLMVQNAAANALTWWIVAASAQQNAFPAAPGCWVHLEPTSLLSLFALGVNPVLVLPTDGTGFLQVAMPIPNDPALLGTTLGMQVLVSDPGAPAGFTVTWAMEALFGF